MLSPSSAKAFDGLQATLARLPVSHAPESQKHSE